MKVIIGLGNPGKKYEKTRHNLGFLLIDKYLEEKDLKLNEEKMGGVYTREILDEKVLIGKPMTFMNLSGDFVRKIVDFYKIDIKDVLIIVDDKDMDFGKVKIKNKTSSGGQNGIKDIEQKLGSDEFYRMKVGVGTPKGKSTKDFVLSNISKSEMIVFDEKQKVFISAIDTFINDGPVEAMNKYNGK